jgi:para-nitrobenzyl esterase
MATQKPVTMGMTSWPTIIADGRVLPADGFAGFARGDWANKVPLIIGSNKEELKLFLSFVSGLDWRSPAYSQAGRYGSLAWKAAGVDEVADAIAGSPEAPPVYVYRFDWGAPDTMGRSPMPGDFGARLGAFHSLEVSFFLGTESCLGPLYTGSLFTTANRPGREGLSGGIMAYLASFARTGDPNALVKGLPAWPERSPDASSALDAGLPSGIVFDASAAEASFSPLLEVLTKGGVEAAIDRDLPPDVAVEVRKRFLVH